MKKIISLILVSAMIFSAFAFASSAAPEGYCIRFDETAAYSIFHGFTFQPNNTTVSFDVSMSEGTNGSPSLSVNGNVTINLQAIAVGGNARNIDWGTAKLEHWRHIDIMYSGNGKANVYLDGMPWANGSASMPDDFIYFLGAPGRVLIDNVIIETGGVSVCNMTFDDLSY